jgi:hypothetical protein
VIPEALERYMGLVTLLKFSDFFTEQLISSIKGKTDSRKDRTERKG